MRNWQLLAVEARRPAAVALPSSPAALAAAVRCANSAVLAFRPRGGGHSYEATSLLDKGLVLDLSRFDKIQVGGGAGWCAHGA